MALNFRNRSGFGRVHRSRKAGAFRNWRTARPRLEWLEARVLPAGLSGMLWHDANADGTRGAGEPPLGNWVAYLDLDDDGRLDASEPTTITDANGNYAFAGLAAAEYHVGAVGQAGWEQTFPTAVPATDLEIELDTVVSSLSGALAMRHAGDGSGRLFVAEQGGLIKIARDGQVLATPFLDLSSKLLAGASGETGLLGLAFHPDFGSSGTDGAGKFYVYYSGPATLGGHHDSVVAEYRVSASDPNVAELGSERVLLRFQQPQSNHNGGDLHFGPDDGLLYIASGDGGGFGDASGNAQNLSNLLGAILRIDVQGTNGPGGQYGIPADNPFAGQAGVREEIYAYGLRNPYRMSFDDDPNGPQRLFVGDVGQNRWEEVDLITIGGNYGWNYREGTHPFGQTPPAGVTLIEPIAEYPNAAVGISVIGGHIYRGDQFPEMAGTYIFADFNGRLMALDPRPDGSWLRNDLRVAGGNPTGQFIRAVGQDESGELYLVTGSSLRRIRSVTPAARHHLTLAAADNASGLDFGVWTAADVGVVQGTVWEDADADGQRTGGEAVLAGVTVYLDQNANQLPDAGETFTRTLPDGSYRFNVPAPGDYRVALVLPQVPDREVTLTAPAGGAFTVSVAAGSTLAERDFGVRIVVPSVRILDNGDAGFGTTQGWTRWSGQGFEGDIHESLAGDGANVASWIFDDVVPGIYRISATWSTYSNRATNSPFAVRDGGTLLATVPVNQRIAPNGFRDAGADWLDLGDNFAVTSNTVSVQLNNLANGNLNADAIRLERLGDLVDGPEIQVLESGVEISSGGAPLDFGSTPPGTPASKTLTIKNVGTQDLELLNPPQVPGGYGTDFVPLVLPAGQSTTFRLTLAAAVEGTYSGVVSIGTNDSDENPFQFDVVGIVATPPPPPAVTIIDNGDAGFATTGSWTRWTGQGYQSDIHESAPGNGSDQASWTFAGLSPGIYRVSATWSTYSNRATNSPFTVRDGATALATVSLNQRLAPNDFNDAGASWEDLGAGFAVTGSLLVIELNDNANGNLNADAIRIERVGELPNGPEIQLIVGGTDIGSGSGQVDFGVTPPGTPVTKTVTINNLGTQELTLAQPLQVPSGYSTSFVPVTVAAGQSATFGLTLDAAASGTFGGIVSLATNDSDENPFQFGVSGSVASQPPPPVVRIIDNGDTGFSTTGSWTRWSGQGFQSDIHESAAGNGADVASWSFAGIEPGVFRVSATWSTYSNRATNSPFTIKDGSTALLTVAVNQRLAPDDLNDAGASWEDLAANVAVTGSLLVVQLSDNANGNLNADAIRIERVGDLPDGPEIQVLVDDTDLLDGSALVGFGNTPPGMPVTKTFTVKNVGTQPLILSAPLQKPSGYSSSFSAATLNAGETTSFTITLDAAVEGTFAGLVSLTNNDSDESPFDLNVSGTVAGGPPPVDVMIIDNGATGFATAGNWSRWTGQGLDGDIHESLPGDGTNVASWTFSDLRSGRYQVAATWSAYFNRASNSPFEVREGTNVLATVAVNQRIAPDDFQDAGVYWEVLDADVAITGSVLTVQLGNLADGRLNADAIRIEYLGPASAGGGGEGEGASGDWAMGATATLATDVVDGGWSAATLARTWITSVSRNSPVLSAMPILPARISDDASRLFRWQLRQGDARKAVFANWNGWQLDTAAVSFNPRPQARKIGNAVEPLEEFGASEEFGPLDGGPVWPNTDRRGR